MHQGDGGAAAADRPASHAAFPLGGRLAGRFACRGGGFGHLPLPGQRAHALTPAGLAAVDRLLGLRVQHTLQDVLVNLRDFDPGVRSSSLTAKNRENSPSERKACYLSRCNLGLQPWPACQNMQM